MSPEVVYLAHSGLCSCFEFCRLPIVRISWAVVWAD